MPPLRGWVRFSWVRFATLCFFLKSGGQLTITGEMGH